MPPRSKQFTTHTWTGLLKHLHQMQIANAPLEEGIDWHIKLDTAHGRAYNRALASMLVLRGGGQVTSEAVDVTAFRDPAMYASWSLEPFTWFTSPRRFNAYDKSATLISNSKALLPTLASTVDKAYEMFSHGAYTHQYARHGVDDAFFQEAFLQVDQVVRNYQTL
jgi:tubulin delta